MVTPEGTKTNNQTSKHWKRKISSYKEIIAGIIVGVLLCTPFFPYLLWGVELDKKTDVWRQGVGRFEFAYWDEEKDVGLFVVYVYMSEDKDVSIDCIVNVTISNQTQTFVWKPKSPQESTANCTYIDMNKNSNIDTGDLFLISNFSRYHGYRITVRSGTWLIWFVPSNIP